MNTEKGQGPYELFLDTNALKNVQWFEQLPREIRTKCVINPWPALLEQWLSNPQFQEATVDRINGMVEGLARLGAPFRNQFAQEQERLMRKNDAALRTQFSLIIPYIVIMKSLMSQRLTADEVLKRLEGILQQDIPRFASIMMLIALGALLKGDQSLKLTGDSKPAFSFLDSFLAFHPGKKDELDHMNIPYLRNRAGDLNLWLCLPQLQQLGYRFVGTPAVVTEDRILHRLIIRTISPALQTNSVMAFSLSSEGLPEALCQKIVSIASSGRIRSISTAKEQLNRMINLFSLAKECCTQDREQQAVDQIFREWWRPGFGKPIVLS